VSELSATCSTGPTGAQDSTVRESMFTTLSFRSSSPIWPRVSQQKSGSTGTSPGTSTIMLRLDFR